MLRAYEAFLIKKGTARTQNVFLFEVGFGLLRLSERTSIR